MSVFRKKGHITRIGATTKKVVKNLGKISVVRGKRGMGEGTHS